MKVIGVNFFKTQCISDIFTHFSWSLWLLTNVGSRGVHIRKYPVNLKIGTSLTGTSSLSGSYRYGSLRPGACRPLFSFIQ